MKIAPRFFIYFLETTNCKIDEISIIYPTKALEKLDPIPESVLSIFPLTVNF